MTEIVTAIYENGVLRPLKPLRLRERQRVRLQISAEELVETTERHEELLQWLYKAGLEAIIGEDDNEDSQIILNDLIAAGVIEEQPWPDVPNEDPVSPERRAELARLLGSAPGKPLSEIIIEERGER